MSARREGGQSMKLIIAVVVLILVMVLLIEVGTRVRGGADDAMLNPANNPFIQTE